MKPLKKFCEEEKVFFNKMDEIKHKIKRNKNLHKYYTKEMNKAVRGSEKKELQPVEAFKLVHSPRNKHN